jgi:hypothetical protein
MTAVLPGAAATARELEVAIDLGSPATALLGTAATVLALSSNGQFGFAPLRRAPECC